MQGEPEQDRASEARDQLTEETEQAAQRARAQAEALSAEMESRLKTIEAKAKAGRQSHQKSGARPEPGGGQVGSVGKGLAQGLTIATSIIGLPLACVAIGFLIELRGGGSEWMKWLGAGGAVVGIAHGAWLASRFNRD